MPGVRKAATSAAAASGPGGGTLTAVTRPPVARREPFERTRARRTAPGPLRAGWATRRQSCWRTWLPSGGSTTLPVRIWTPWSPPCGPRWCPEFHPPTCRRRGSVRGVPTTTGTPREVTTRQLVREIDGSETVSRPIPMSSPVEQRKPHRRHRHAGPPRHRLAGRRQRLPRPRPDPGQPRRGPARLLASTPTGDEVFELRFRDLRTGADLPDVVPRSYYGGAWSADSRWFFYTVHDEAYRPAPGAGGTGSARRPRRRRASCSRSPTSASSSTLRATPQRRR